MTRELFVFPEAAKTLPGISPAGSTPARKNDAGSTRRLVPLQATTADAKASRRKGEANDQSRPED